LSTNIAIEYRVKGTIGPVTEHPMIDSSVALWAANNAIVTVNSKQLSAHYAVIHTTSIDRTDQLHSSLYDLRHTRHRRISSIGEKRFRYQIHFFQTVQYIGGLGHIRTVCPVHFVVGDDLWFVAVIAGFGNMGAVSGSFMTISRIGIKG
jgi:hypothetical protein